MDCASCYMRIQNLINFLLPLHSIESSENVTNGKHLKLVALPVYLYFAVRQPLFKQLPDLI